MMVRWYEDEEEIEERRWRKGKKNYVMVVLKQSKQRIEAKEYLLFRNNQKS